MGLFFMSLTSIVSSLDLEDSGAVSTVQDFFSGRFKVSPAVAYPAPSASAEVLVERPIEDLSLLCASALINGEDAEGLASSRSQEHWLGLNWHKPPHKIPIGYFLPEEKIVLFNSDLRMNSEILHNYWRPVRNIGYRPFMFSKELDLLEGSSALVDGLFDLEDLDCFLLAKMRDPEASFLSPVDPRTYEILDRLIDGLKLEPDTELQFGFYNPREGFPFDSDYAESDSSANIGELESSIERSTLEDFSGLDIVEYIGLKGEEVTRDVRWICAGEGREFRRPFKLTVEQIRNKELDCYVRGVDPTKCLYLDSRISIGDRELNIPMMDFDKDVTPDYVNRLTLGRPITMEGMLVHSGNSSHFYGFDLLNRDQMEDFMIQAHRNINFAADDRYIQHCLNRGFTVLRLTACYDKLHQPTLYKPAEPDESVSPAREKGTLF